MVVFTWHELSHPANFQLKRLAAVQEAAWLTLIPIAITSATATLTKPTYTSIKAAESLVRWIQVTNSLLSRFSTSGTILSKPCSTERYSMLFQTVMHALSQLACPTRCGHVPKVQNSSSAKYNYTAQTLKHKPLQHAVSNHDTCPERVGVSNTLWACA
jgi:hypothetical protein